MDSPFKFGKIVEGRFFTDREEDVKRLFLNFENNINTILISPRRWGKSSVVNKSAEKACREDKNLRVCFVDLFNIRNESQFYAYYIKQIIKSTSSKPEEWAKIAKLFLSRITPKISIPVNDINDFEISFEMRDKAEDFEDVLNLPEKIAEKKKIKILVCIDEFQNLNYFDDPLLFQKRLRSAWQKHKKVTYCIYGSQTHMMTELFENQSMPFYKFGDVMFLQKIKSHYLVKFIIDSFRGTKKSIEHPLAEKIVNLMECNPYYVQQLAHLTWIRTERKADNRVVDSAIDDLITQNTTLYTRDVELISNSQIRFIEALIGINENIFSADVISRYELGSTANVTKIINALIKKEIIHRVSGKYELIDPAFKLWLRKVYMKKG